MTALRAWLPKRSRTPGELLSRLGRGVLWLGVAVVLARGLAGILNSAPRPAAHRVTASAAVWPDEAARAYAIEFAAAYLTIAPDEPATRTAAAELAAAGIADALAPTLDEQAAAQQVESAAVAGVTRLDARRALVTVAARVRGARPRTIRLTVPVARDARGALVVNDLPALAPAPSRAAVGPLAGAPILGAERAAIADVLRRFLAPTWAATAPGWPTSSPPARRSPPARAGSSCANWAR